MRSECGITDVQYTVCPLLSVGKMLKIFDKSHLTMLIQAAALNMYGYQWKQ